MALPPPSFSSGRAYLTPPRTHPVLRSLPLYLGFAATGVCVALPGAALPAMLVRWHLTDAQGGRLFLLAWMGSSLGALGVRGSLRAALTAGCAFAALGSAGLGFGSGAEAYLSMMVYGVGLGLTMTSITLLRQRSAGRSGTDLVRLNLVWAAGACLAPGFAAPALRAGDLRPLLGSLAVVFGLLGLWAAMQPQFSAQRVSRHSLSGWAALRRVPPALVLITMLITGVEAAAGAWLATYAHRSGDRLAEVIAAPTCLWAGVLLSRFVWSTWDGWASAHATVRGSVTLTLGAGLLLTLGGGGWPILVAAFCLGFGIGPVYPLVLDWVLHVECTGAIFFLAGVGSATLPWLTGVVSAAHHSLRVGFVVVLSASAVIAALAWLSPLERWSKTPISKDRKLRIAQPSDHYPG